MPVKKFRKFYDLLFLLFWTPWKISINQTISSFIEKYYTVTKMCQDCLFYVNLLSYNQIGPLKCVNLKRML